MMNPADMMKIMSAKRKFDANHPKFSAFLKAVLSRPIEEGTVIEGEFTLEKLMMAVDPDQAFVDFWEGTNA